MNNIRLHLNHLGSNPMVRAWETKRFVSSMVSGSNSVVAYMMATGGLYDR
jgi:hypothetical protein